MGSGISFTLSPFGPGPSTVVQGSKYISKTILPGWFFHWSCFKRCRAVVWRQQLPTYCSTLFHRTDSASKILFSIITV